MNVVRRDNHGRPQLIECSEQLQKTTRHFGIHIARRLISNEHFWATDDSTCDGDTLLLTARKRCRSGVRAFGKADPFQHFGYRTFQIFFLNACDP